MSYSLDLITISKFPPRPLIHLLHNLLCSSNYIEQDIKYSFQPMSWCNHTNDVASNSNHDLIAQGDPGSSLMVDWYIVNSALYPSWTVANAPSIGYTLSTILIMFLEAVRWLRSVIVKSACRLYLVYGPWLIEKAVWVKSKWNTFSFSHSLFLFFFG